MSRKQKSTTLGIGTVSEGTMRSEDLIPSFMWEADRIQLSRDERKQVNEIKARYDAADEDSEYWQEEAQYDVNSLFNILGNHVPDYCYFGATDGDGACYGVWVSMESLEEDISSGDVLKVDDLSEVESSETRLVAQVSDHGNVSLYRPARGRFVEVWAVV